MNDEKTSSTFVKDGIKNFQKRSNPVELFVKKRVKNKRKQFSNLKSSNILFVFSYLI